MSAPRSRRQPGGTTITESDVPCAVDAERSVLGAMQLEPRALEWAAAILQPSHFYHPAHVAIFAAGLRLRSRGAAIDAVTLVHELEAARELVMVGGPAYIASLLDGVPRSANVEHYARIVRDKAARRAIMERALELAGACRNGHETHELTDAGAALFLESLAADPATMRRVRPTAEVAAEYVASVARGKAHRLWTGLGALDTATQGIAPGEVMTVVARPQVGKSALASQVINNAAAANEPCLFLSLEMPREQAFERLVMQRLGVSRAHVEDLSRDGWAGLRPQERAALDALAGAVVIVDVGKSAVADLDGAVTEASGILGRAPRLIVIDYLGLLGSGAKNLPLYQRVSEAAVDVKSFAKRHGAAVVLLSQSGRDQDAKRSAGAAELGLDAARDSGQVEEAADFLVTLWRPELDPDLTPEARRELAGQLHGSLCKNRRGPRPTFRLMFDTHTLQIGDWPEAT